MYLNNLEYGKIFGLRQGFKVCTVTYYIGGYTGDNDSKREWSKERTETWEQNVFMISKTAGKYPKESYAMVVRAIQL